MADPDPPAAPEPEAGGHPEPLPFESRREAASAKVNAVKRWVSGHRARLEDRRSDTWWIEIGFRLLERDVRAAGAVMGGGLAYRLFFWTLALAVLIAGGLGFAAEGGVDVGTGSRNVGLREQLSRTIAEAAAESRSGRWWLLVSGLFLVVWFAWSLVRALRLVHASAWAVRPDRRSPRPGGVLGAVSAPVALVAISTATSWLRSQLGPLTSLLGWALGTVLLVALLVVVCTRLPTPPGVPWTAHLPGAVLLVVGIQVASFFVQIYLSEKLASQQALYGTLGLAATTLFTLYLLGRCLVWVFELNSVTWEVWSERRPHLRLPAGIPIGRSPAAGPSGGEAAPQPDEARPPG